MSFILAFCSKCGKRNIQNEYTYKNNDLICKECWLIDNNKVLK